MSENNESPSVTYSQGMTDVWSDGEKITVYNRSGIRWVRDNVDQIFGLGEFDKILNVAYMEVNHAVNKHSSIKAYECVSGYIPQRVIDDLKELSKEQLPEEDKKKAALEALKGV